MAENRFSTLVPDGLVREDVALLCDLLCDCAPHGGRTPLIAPAMLLGAPGLAPLIERMQPPPNMGVVHESQMFRQVRSPSLATPLAIEGLVEDIGAAQKVEFTLSQGMDAVGAMETRLRFVAPEVIQSLKGTRFRNAMNDPDMRWTETGALSQALVNAYLDLSHDPNPIHREDDAARAIGLSQTVVPGMLIAGLSEVALQAREVVAREMRTRFLAPLPVGERLRFAIRVFEAPKARARVFAISGKDQIVAITDFHLESSH
ncbi:MAG: MaoC family dehydratase [Rhodobacteraceae bacterium]|nr:MaoC family dehydratase [Paracoccaceae bacterium]